MAARKNIPGTSGPPAKPKPATPRSRRRGNSIRRWTHSTLFAAGLAAMKLSEGHDDPEMPLFNMTLVDRLRVTITRYHE